MKNHSEKSPSVFLALGSCYWATGTTVDEAKRKANQHKPNVASVQRERPAVYKLPDAAHDVKVSNMGHVKWRGGGQAELIEKGDRK